VEALVLNAGAIPVSIVSWRRAVVLVQCGKAVALAHYENSRVRSSGFVATIPTVTSSKSARVELEVPSVIQCVHSDFVPKHYTTKLPFNRRNVYIRDKGTCMYCGKKVSLSSFTFDHVTPRSQGGTTCWENIVVSCMRCNRDKGNSPLSRCKQRLLRPPFAPRLDKAAPAHIVSKIAAEIPHETWADYIYWNIIIEP